MKRYRQLHCVLCCVVSPLVARDSAELANWVEVEGTVKRHYCGECGRKLFEPRKDCAT